MAFCFNPDCSRPLNLDSHQFCQSCGAKLLLKERYQAIKPIGQGGFGKTFLGCDRDKPSKPPCVIKLFLPASQGTDSMEKAIQLFNQEAKRLESLGKHPQIPELLAHFEQESRLYLVQEYIEGQNLAAILQEEGAWQERDIQSFLLGLLSALQFVHENNVIHRDIKPENIIKRAEGDSFVLVDFGAARCATGTALLRTGTVIGDPRYMPDEQVQGRASFASDLYSLGLTCLHLLTNVEPWSLFDTSEGEWVWRDYLTGSISQDLGAILDKMVQKPTKKRFQSAKEVLTALQPSSAQRQAPQPVQPSTSIQRSTPAALGTFSETLRGGVTLGMVQLPAGEFWMGTEEEEVKRICKQYNTDWYNNELPRHQVRVSAFAIGKYPITQEQYQAVMGKNPSHFSHNPRNPVEKVSWHDAQAFCRKLTEITGKAYRLPTEAEWEYACRAGTQTRYSFGDNEQQLGDYAWLGVNSDDKTHPVGQKKPNFWGLYDMHGNVWEWCEDDWHDNYQGAPTNGSAWIAKNGDKRSKKMLRSGSWDFNSRHCRSAHRIRLNADYYNYMLGFRVVCPARP